MGFIDQLTTGGATLYETSRFFSGLGIDVPTFGGILDSHHLQISVGDEISTIGRLIGTFSNPWFLLGGSAVES